ncbi:unnamed protein product [Symbiodinium sp. CCMP2456]|nr:unnamed protein product [Symbiodinium sp. CCMP2456]
MDGSSDAHRLWCQEVPSGPAFHNMDKYNFTKLLLEMSADMVKTRCDKTSWGIAAAELFEDDSDEAYTDQAEQIMQHPPQHMVFVNVPLGVYVRNSPHLYEMLSRMRCLQKDSAVGSVKQMLAILDADGHSYSVLVYAVIAAMQVLFQVARARTPAVWKLQELWPLNGSTLDSWSCLSCEKLMFRGIWVPQEVDEAAATWQRSFNSFSREVDGVRKVLRFYAKSRGTSIATLAQKDQHILLFVARRIRQEDWAFPMQFFSWHESREGSLERELVLPPFAAYDFESDLEVSSRMPGIIRAEKMSILQQRWGLPAKFFDTEVPKLMRWLGDPKSMLLHDLLGSPPQITVRFVRKVTLADPVRCLLEADVPSLLQFPQCWRVVGGEQMGGLLVRQGPALDSPIAPQRLQFGATVAEIETQGVRMHYRMVLGDGPPQGWITTFVQQSNKRLVVPE